jgi:hypothetical protein
VQALIDVGNVTDVKLKQNKNIPAIVVTAFNDVGNVTDRKLLQEPNVLDNEVNDVMLVGNVTLVKLRQPLNVEPRFVKEFCAPALQFKVFNPKQLLKALPISPIVKVEGIVILSNLKQELNILLKLTPVPAVEGKVTFVNEKQLKKQLPMFTSEGMDVGKTQVVKLEQPLNVLKNVVAFKFDGKMTLFNCGQVRKVCVKV